MANSFRKGSDFVRMSNGRTAVVFDLLAISGTARARTDWERKLVYWLVQQDRERVGLGMASFDVREMGWTRDGFASEVAFVLGVIDAAIRREGAELLAFTPGEHVVAALEELRRLIEELTVDEIDAVA